jgi:hypothetical protein
MINLRADNRSLTKDAKYSYLMNNFSSGVSTFSIGNTDGFFHNSIILVGNIGSGNTEILTLQKVDPNTGSLTFANFTDIVSGSGILTVNIANGGTGYQLGEILTVIQAGGINGSVRVSSIGALGTITGITVNQGGNGYTVANGLVTTGGGNNDATINILSVSAISTPTSIIFDKSHNFIAGQPVEIFSPLGVSRGTGIVGTSSNPASNILSIVSPGIFGVTAGDEIVVGDITKFAHSESTKVTVIQYDKVRFFRTETPAVPNAIPYTSLNQNQDKFVTETTLSTISNPATTVYTKADDPSSVIKIDFTPPVIFEGATPLTVPLSIQANEFFTTFIDSVNSTGYGWFAFYNSASATYSPISNPIPYGGFPQNTVKKTFEAFDSSLNSKELKLISQADRFNWLNEGVAYLVNELNLVNLEYNASEEIILTVKAAQPKYLLPQDFSDLLFILDHHGHKMESYDALYERPEKSALMRYSVRGKFIIFYPSPDRDTTVTIAYLKNSPVFTELDDVIDLPNNAYYIVKDFMRYRAYQKLQNSPEAQNAYTFFVKEIENMKIRAIRRDDGLDSWDIAYTANI